ncbi:MarR family winged helix-turn-helix transcriptional regulator [Carnobacterium gallinarum]|uniref:MarR family winged helix-turn-helix transcriptional regulator n=1 Tax=Carnobacterium gallinarum TaxID=2749 RepID=UPI000AF8104F|nr:MarR family winged helix-turn-helix transcriptional regulator [Carnobacterium gallinarum]
MNSEMDSTNGSLNMKMKRLNRLHKKLADQELNSLDLHIGQSLILEVILTKEQCTQKEIADYLDISTSSITNPIKRLEEKKLIEKKQANNDLRYNSITLTATGHEIAQKIITKIDGINQTMVHGFSQEEVILLNHLMDSMIQNLDPTKEITQLKKDEFGKMYKNYLEVNNGKPSN